MAREERKKLIETIEQKRGSKVIVYITSDRPNLGWLMASDVVSIVHKHILPMHKSGSKKFDLFLYSRGGHSDVPWTIVSMFREYCNKGIFSVLVPYRAHSAATVVALGADEIVMTRKAELGPIDMTINNGPYNPKDDKTGERLPVSVEDVTGYFSLLKKVGGQRADEKMNGFNMLTSHVHPLVLGHVNRGLEETKQVGLRLLSTRAKPFSEEDNQEIIKKISTEVYSHSHAINRTEAKKYIGLKQIKNAEDLDIADEMWALYEEYNKLFKFEEPYKPEEYLIVSNVEEYVWTNLYMACVESANRVDTYKQDLKVKKLRKIPPQVNLNLNNLNFPQVTIPNLPEGTNPQQIQAIVQAVVQGNIQQLLNQAVNAAVEKLLESLPIAGFEKIAYNAAWKEGE